MDWEAEKKDWMELHWMTMLLRNIDVGIVVLDREYKVHEWNAFMENHSGVPLAEIRNRNLFEAFPEIPQQWFQRKCEAVLQVKHHCYNTWQEKPSLISFKNYRPITNPEQDMYQNFTIFPITSLTGETEFITIIIYDVTDIALGKKQLEKANTTLTQQSRTDQLTNLFNRWYWELRLEQEFERYMRYGLESTLIMLDIDHFKQVNDTYGHPTGDEAIRCLAKTIAREKRNTDIAGRYGGEEFGIILTETNSQNATVFAERLRKAVEDSVIEHLGTSLKITISLGLAEFTNKVDGHESILGMADEALYKSKRNGRNRYTIYQEPVIEEVVNNVMSAS